MYWSDCNTYESNQIHTNPFTMYCVQITPRLLCIKPNFFFWQVLVCIKILIQAKYIQIRTKYMPIHTNTCQSRIQTGAKPVDRRWGVIHTNTYKYIPNTSQYLPNTCQIHVNLNHLRSTGFAPVCIRIVSVFACICMYLHVFDMYRFVFYKPDPNQYWQNEENCSWTYRQVLVCINMYCSVLTCIEPDWLVFILFFIKLPLSDDQKARPLPMCWCRNKRFQILAR